MSKSILGKFCTYMRTWHLCNNESKIFLAMKCIATICTEMIEPLSLGLSLERPVPCFHFQKAGPSLASLSGREKRGVLLYQRQYSISRRSSCNSQSGSAVSRDIFIPFYQTWMLSPSSVSNMVERSDTCPISDIFVSYCHPSHFLASLSKF